jgi:hypothetical protein
LGKLNEPRSIPYAFRVVEIDDIVWLYDDSERTHLCSAQKSIWAEPLYSTGEDTDGLVDGIDPAYFDARTIEALVSMPVRLDDEYTGPQVSETEAWDAAREAAHANHLL